MSVPIRTETNRPFPANFTYLLLHARLERLGKNRVNFLFCPRAKPLIKVTSPVARTSQLLLSQTHFYYCGHFCPQGDGLSASCGVFFLSFFLFLF